jgi:flagellar hook assembly protein FlgD
MKLIIMHVTISDAKGTTVRASALKEKEKEENNEESEGKETKRRKRRDVNVE